MGMMSLEHYKIFLKLFWHKILPPPHPHLRSLCDVLDLHEECYETHSILKLLGIFIIILQLHKGIIKLALPEAEQMKPN